MNTFLENWPEWMVRSSLAIALTAISVIVVLRIVRLRSPILHRMAWVVVLIQGCVMTRIAFEVPWYTVDASTMNAGSDRESVPIDIELKRPLSAEAANSTPLSTSAGGSTQDAAIVESRANATQGDTGQFIPSNEDSSSALASAAPAALSNGHSFWQMGVIGWSLVVWATGVLVILLIHALGYFSLLRSLKLARPAPPDWTEQWDFIAAQCSLGSRNGGGIPMLVHASLGPMICLTPRGYVIVVPRDLWEELTVKQRSAVLHHELAHYLRGDVWKSLLARLIALPHWFNPFAWLAVRKFDECGEWACDRFLTSRDPQGASEFAKALLKIMQFPHRLGIGFRGAGSSFLTERIRRLCLTGRSQESVMKRFISVLLLMLVFIFGMSEIRPVAVTLPQDDVADEKSARSVASPILSSEQQLEQLAKELFVDGDDDLLEEFQKSLATPAGKTAMLERATFMENELRERAQQNAMPEYLATYFDRDGKALRLKPDQQSFRDETIRKAAEYQQDVDEIQAAMARIRDRLADDREAEKLIRRALAQETTAWVLYAQEIRPRIRPDEMTIRELYQAVFVDNGNDQLIIRPAIRAEIQRQLDNGEVRRRALPRIRQELLNWSEDISSHDEIHKNLKQIFQDDFFVRICCFQAIGEEGNPDEGIQNLFNYLENIFEDHSDGLRLNVDGQARMEELVGRFEQRRQMAQRLSEPLEQMVSKIPDGYDELHDRLKRAFDAGFTIVRLTQDGMFQAVSAGEFTENLLAERLVENDDGQLIVPEDVSEEVIEQVRNILRTGRELRRRFASVNADLAQIEDEALRSVFDSMAGKYVMLRSIRRQYSSRQFDGMGQWIDEHFDRTDDGFVLMEDARGAIQDYLQQVQEIRQEMANDDF